MSEFKKYALQGLFTKNQRELRQFDRDLLVLLEEMNTNLGNLLNRGLNFDDNFESKSVTYTSNGSANTEDAVAHTLGKIPEGFIVVNRDKGGILYASGTAWTSTAIYLKCTTTSMASTVLVF